MSLSIELEQGNIIKNQRQFDWQGSFNLQSLYNKNKYLKKDQPEIYGLFPGSARQPEKKEERGETKKEIELSPDSGTIVQHGMFTKKVRITARGADGKVYSIKYKPINYAQSRS